MPVRNVSDRHGRNRVGKFPSLKLGRMVAFESSLERDQIFLLEYDPTVVSFEEQPLTIPYDIDGQPHTYTPDFKAIARQGRPVVIECKPERYADKQLNLRKFAAARAWCAARNWDYQVQTEADLRAGYRLENVMHLWRFARQRVQPDTRARIYEILTNDSGPVTLGELAAIVNYPHPQAGLGAIFSLLFHHELYAEIDTAKLSANSPVYLARPQEVTR